MPMACIMRWGWMHSTSRDPPHSSSHLKAKSAGSLSAPRSMKGHSSKKSSQLSKLAINIEAHAKRVGPLKRVQRRRDRFLTREHQLERVPERRFLQPDRDAGPVFFSAFEAGEPRYVLADQ